MLATGALVASLLAVGASPSGAQPTPYSDKASEATALSACVGDALGDEMFTDVSDDHAFRDAINCVAYYGITNGTGDGSTYSPNQDVTRAQMAVFIARAAGVAGVDLGDAMGDEFTDIGDTWAEARDAINQLASKGVIASGGAFRPDDAITRGEMATFLVGLLAKVAAAPNVMKDSSGVISQLGSTTRADFNYFADARSSVPSANDAEISALYELGITKGASAAAVQDDSKAPLDFNYEPAGTVNRGQMAAFITRALAHTDARPEGVSAQYDDGNVILSARDADFRPVTRGVVIDVFSIDTSDADLAFRANGACSTEVAKVEFGTYPCEIEGSDLSTGGDGEATVPLAATAIAAGGTTVWAWTGDTGDTVDSDTDLFRLDIPKTAGQTPADRVRVTSEHPAGLSSDVANNPNNKKVHLGSSVLYTLQLEDTDGNNTTVGADVADGPARFVVRLETYAISPAGRSADPSVVTTLPLTTDADGKATFPVSGLPDLDPGTPGDKYVVDVYVASVPNGNSPANIAIGTGAAVALAAAPAKGNAVRAGATAGSTYATVDTNDLVFSTEASIRTAPTGGANVGASVSVTPAATFVAASDRGASNRATVSVVDQYGDPVPGVLVSLATNLTNEDATAIVIGNNRVVKVGRDGSYTFGYSRVGDAAATETLTPTWDDDGDGCAAASGDVATDCANIVGATAGVAGPTARVHWAPGAATSGVLADRSQDGTNDYIIQEFDTDANRIFVATVDTSTDDNLANNSARVLYYDSNDRFNVGTAAGVTLNSITASNYAGFERALAVGKELSWSVAAGGSSRDVNLFGVTPSS